MGEVQGGEKDQATGRTLRDQKRQQLRNVRLLLILPFAVTAILVAPLGILKKASEVEVSLKVSQLSFVIGEQGNGLFNGLPTASLSLLSFQKVDLGPAVLEIATAIDPNSDTPTNWRQIGRRTESRIISRDHFASVTFQDVSLNQLSIPPGSVTTLSWLDSESNFLKLRVDGGEATGRIAAGRKLRLSCNACEVSGLPPGYDLNSKFLRFTAHRRHVMTFRGRREGTTLAVELPPGMKLVEQNVYIKGDVDFTQLEGARRISTVIGEEGKITFKELGNEEVKVSAGDFVILNDLQDFFLKTLHVEDGINIVLHGRAGKLATGPQGFVKDRLPSLLEFLYAGQIWGRWALYLNAVVLIGTTILAILKRLRILREEEQGNLA
ncbi:MAG: hypothetical protein ACE5I9_00340 [Candidatus Methylomirabilales bacterium]